MALGIKAAGAGLGLVVTLAALVGLSVLAPLPDGRTGQDDTRAALGQIDAPEPAVTETTLPAPVADLPDVAAQTQPDDASGDAGAAPDIAMLVPDLPEPSVSDATSAFAEAPPASTPAPGDMAALALATDRLTLPSIRPQAALPDVVPPRDGMPDAAPLPPAAPESELETEPALAEPAPATSTPEAEQSPAAQPEATQPLPELDQGAGSVETLPAPDQQPVPDSDTAPDLSDSTQNAPPSASPAMPAPVITTLPGRPVTGLPGQPVNRPDPEPESAEADLAPRPDTQAIDDSALIRNAVLVQPEPGRPLMALILADPGLPMTERLALAARPLPFTVALNPMDPTAPEAAALYLENGKEVLLIASGLPSGATASDVEVTFSAHFAALPQAAGVIDLPRDGFTRNAVLMGDVMQVVARDGHGLVTFAGGLGNPGRAAEAAGIRHTEVFRVLDTAEDSPFTIRRFLDRAVFQATQIGQVVVYGEASSPGLLEALDMWQSEGRVDQVALVPVSGILLSE